MKNTSEHILFGPSGCLSHEGLLLYGEGNLGEQELAAVKAHLQTCEFCAMAVEGLAMVSSKEFNQDLEAMYASLKDEPNKILDNQEIERNPIRRKSFFRRYRLEMIAAVMLLLLAFGARQIYVGLSPEKQQPELARFEPEDVGEMEIIQEEITRSEPLAEERMERKPTPLAPVQIALVSDNQEHIPAPTAEPAIKNTQEKVDSDAFQNENNASGRVMQIQYSEEEEEVEIFTIVEDAPEFPGGDKKRIEFLAENIKYPNEAREFGVQGTVYVGFVVEKDGSIKDPRVLRGIGGGCDEATLRAIRLMPKWKPGSQRGKPVRVRMTLPVRFSVG